MTGQGERMPARRNPVWGIIVAIGLIGLALWLFSVGRKVDAIHRYLGNNRGDDSTTWSGLVGNISRNNAQLKGAINRMACRIWVLEHPGEPEPVPCPPGPPTGSPTKPPAYPP